MDIMGLINTAVDWFGIENLLLKNYSSGNASKGTNLYVDCPAEIFSDLTVVSQSTIFQTGNLDQPLSRSYSGCLLMMFLPITALYPDSEEKALSIRRLYSIVNLTLRIAIHDVFKKLRKTKSKVSSCKMFETRACWKSPIMF